MGEIPKIIEGNEGEGWWEARGLGEVFERVLGNLEASQPFYCQVRWVSKKRVICMSAGLAPKHRAFIFVIF